MSHQSYHHRGSRDEAPTRLPVFLQDVATKSKSIKRVWWACGIAAAVLLLIIFSAPKKHITSEAAALWDSCTQPSSPLSAAANSTLGFSTIYAITTNTTWRVQGLEAAANLTGLEIELFHPSNKSETEVEAFRTAHPLKNIGRGKALAWLAHLDVVSHILEKKHESALVIEDDVDWDVYVKEQMLQVARAFAVRRNFLDGEGKPESVEGVNAEYPYGLNWDLLWIGHNFEDMSGLAQREQYMWYDATAPLRKQYWGRTPWFDRIPPKHRALLGANGPVSTFAYALTASGARKLHAGGEDLKLYPNKKPEAFDVRLARLCHNGQLYCLMVAPELFHHHIPPQKDGFVASDSVLADAGHEHANHDTNANATTVGMGITDNILDSARCMAVFNTTCAPKEHD